MSVARPRGAAKAARKPRLIQVAFEPFGAGDRPANPAEPRKGTADSWPYWTDQIVAAPAAGAPLGEEGGRR